MIPVQSQTITLQCFHDINMNRTEFVLIQTNLKQFLINWSVSHSNIGVIPLQVNSIILQLLKTLK